MGATLAEVSTHRMDKLVKSLGINGLSKSEVSRMAEELDEHGAAFRHRPLGQVGPFTFLAADALIIKSREAGRVINADVRVTTGANGDGHREVLRLQVATGKTKAARNTFLADLVARGLAGVRLVTSDPHAGLVEAIAADLMSITPKSMWPAVKAMLHSVYDQPDGPLAHAQFDRLGDYVNERLPAAAEHRESVRDDLLAFTGFPKDILSQIWPNNPAKRLNKEIRRRADAVGIFPNREAIIRLVGHVPAEQTDEWTEPKRYLGLEVLARCRLTPVPGINPEEVTEPLALTA